MTLPVVILAAGRGKRFKRKNKLLAEIKGKPVLQWVIDNTIGSGAELVLVVLGYQAEKIKKVIKGNVKFIINENWEEGKSTSIQRGIKALSQLYPDAPGCIFLLGDEPFIPPSLIRKAGKKFKETDKIVFSVIRGKMFHPVVFPKRFFPELYNLKRDEGGRKIIERFKGETIKLPFQKEFKDIDTLSDLEKTQGLRVKG